MNTEVSVKSSLTRPPVVVRAILANNSPKTQVSRRLAKKLGLTNSVRDVFVSDALNLMGTNVALKWKISLQPITITVKNLENYNVKVVYPLINYSEHDAFWEMIIGKDCPEQWDVLNACVRQPGGKPTEGPGYSPNTQFMGHNIRLTNLQELTNPPDEYFEFPCFDSEALSRLAVNKRSSKVVAVFHDSTAVYVYDEVPLRLIAMIESGASLGQTVATIKASCPVSTIGNFPRAVLTNYQL